MSTTFVQATLRELELETRATRRCLETVDASLFDYKPHEKSMAMGYLASLVAEIPLWIAHMIKEGEIDFVTFPHKKLTNSKELVQHFEENIEAAKKALQSTNDEALEETFTLKANGQTVYSASKKENIETTINHLVHHRGQLTVYMRLNDLKVPSIYGPSADDRSF